MDIITTFLRAAERHSDRAVLVDSDLTVTYAEADRRTDAIAAELIGRGVEPEDTVGLCASDRVSLWLAVIGSWKAGALPALIDARLGSDDVAYFVEDVGGVVMAAATERHDVLEAAGATSIVDLDSLGEVESAAVNHHGPDSPLYLSYTSGTTGLPKGAVLRSSPVTLGTACIGDRLNLTRDDVLLATTPIPSSFQLVSSLMPAIAAGSSVALVSGRPVSEMWDVARAAGATILVAYPLTLADVVNAPAAADDSPFRLALSGGSPLAPRIKRDYQTKLGVALLESYGQSELGGFMAMGSPDDGPRSLEGYVGRSLPDRLAYVGGEAARELPPGEIGEVLVTHGYFPEYRNKPEKFAEATAGGVLHTGDVAISDADGYLKVLGRTREAATAAMRGGFMRDVEDAIYSHEAVLHAAVVEKADGSLAGFYQHLEGHTAEPEELCEHVAGSVPGGLLPSEITCLDAMPRTFSGKADRFGLATRAII